MDSEEALAQFEYQLKDRFGPLPEVVKTLIDSMRLRWKAQEIGFTKLVIKSGKMIGYFLNNPEHPYYQSPIFTQVLNYIQGNPPNVKMSEKNDKLRLIYTGVDSIEDALTEIRAILPEKAVTS
jgi:transcription-repair coupling factor (superfamily II helicase)